jgi:S1-C subfamily serine protease
MGSKPYEEVLIKRLVGGSPAKRAGLTAGLQIQQVNKRQVRSVRQFHALLSRYLPGEAVTLEIYDPNTGRRTQATVKLVRGEDLQEE